LSGVRGVRCVRAIRRWVGRAGLACSIVIVGAFVFSVLRPLWVDSSVYDSIGLSHGCFVRVHCDSVMRGGPIARYPRVRFSLPGSPRSPRLRPLVMAPDVYIIPLWIPFAPAAVASLCLLGRERVAGHCRRCGYDLRGNTGAVCPECGA
jgi:hypothetical protein